MACLVELLWDYGILVAIDMSARPGSAAIDWSATDCFPAVVVSLLRMLAGPEEVLAP
jgi:hypothetical protein